MITLLFVLLFIVAFIVFFSKVDSQKIILELQDTNYFLVFLSYITTFIIVICGFFRWYFLVKAIKPTVLLRNILDIYLVALLSNYASPGKMGVPVKSALLKFIERISVGRSLPAILGEIFLDVILLTIFLIFSTVFGRQFAIFYQITKEFITRISSIVMGQLIWLLLFIVVIFLLIYLLWRKTGVLTKAWKATRNFMDTPKCMYMGIVFTAFLWASSFIQGYLLFLAFGEQVSFFFVILLFSFSVLIGYLSPLPGGMGIRELSIAGITGIILGNYEVGITIAIFARVMFFLVLPVVFLYRKFFIKITL